jgi:hypothetical protein
MKFATEFVPTVAALQERLSRLLDGGHAPSGNILAGRMKARSDPE